MNICIEQFLHPRRTPPLEIERRVLRSRMAPETITSTRGLIRELNQVMRIGRSPYDRHVFVAFDDDVAIATAALIPIPRPDEYHGILCQIFVEKSRRLSGVGRELVLYVLSQARNQFVMGMNRMQYLQAPVPRRSQEARVFFERCRFRPQPRLSTEEPIIEFRSYL